MSVLDELILLVEVFDGFFLALHFSVLHLDASFKPYVFLSDVVVLLLQADSLFIKLFMVKLGEYRLLSRFPRLAMVLNHSFLRRMIRSSLED